MSSSQFFFSFIIERQKTIGLLIILLIRLPLQMAEQPGQKAMGPGGEGGGNSAYERGGDARRLARGSKFRTLVSLRVFWAKRYHIQPCRSRLGLHVTKYKIYILSVFQHGLFQGSKKGWAMPRSVSFRGLIQNFRRASPPLSYAESAPPPPGPWGSLHSGYPFTNKIHSYLSILNDKSKLSISNKVERYNYQSTISN